MVACVMQAFFMCEPCGRIVPVVSCSQMSSPGLRKPQEHFVQGKGWKEARELSVLPPHPVAFFFSPCSQSLPDFLWAASPSLTSDLFGFSKAITFVTAPKDPPG